MSSLSVKDILGLATYNNTISIPSGNNLQVDDKITVGELVIPVWTSTTRPSSPEVGNVGYNSQDGFQKIEYWTGSEWLGVGESTYSDGVTNGLVLWLDLNKESGYSGNIVTDHSSTMGDVNVQNRSTDWSVQTESSTSLECIYNQNNRVSNAGINVPMNNGWNKQTATIEMWIRPVGDYTGGHGWFNNSDGASYTNNANWFWWGSWNGSENHYARWGNTSTCCNDMSFAGFQSFYPLNTWFHWAIAWDTGLGSATLYKNGSIIQSKTNVPTNVTNSNPTNTGQLFNGHSRSDNMQFKGYCSQYRIYNRALSVSEINQNYTTYAGVHNL